MFRMLPSPRCSAKRPRGATAFFPLPAGEVLLSFLLGRGFMYLSLPFDRPARPSPRLLIRDCLSQLLVVGPLVVAVWSVLSEHNLGFADSRVRGLNSGRLPVLAWLMSGRERRGGCSGFGRLGGVRSLPPGLAGENYQLEAKGDAGTTKWKGHGWEEFAGGRQQRVNERTGYQEQRSTAIKAGETVL